MFDILTDDNCKWCDKAKELLLSKKLAFREWWIGDEKIIAMAKILKLKSVPQIFDEGKHIGGYTDLVKYFNENFSNGQ